MKNVILLLLISSTIFAQEKSTVSLLDLHYRFYTLQNSSYKPQNQEIGIQNSESTFNNPTSSIQNQLPTLQPPASRKNPGLAILFSLVLPGMGELYAGGYDSGKYFTIADGVLWGVFIGFNSYGNWKQDNYKSFAKSQAGVNLDGKDAILLMWEFI